MIETKKSETKRPETVETKPSDTVIIGTDRLTEIVNETVKPKNPYTDKRLRSVIRNDSVLNVLKTSDYTKYRFRYPSDTVNRIIDRFRQIETERSERRKRSESKRSEIRNRSITVIELNENGTVKTETVKPETETKPSDK